jgi:hypothetical protein
MLLLALPLGIIDSENKVEKCDYYDSGKGKIGRVSET